MVETVATVVRDLRINANMTKKELAKALNLETNVEKGRANFSEKRLDSISGVDSDYMKSLEENKVAINNADRQIG